MCPAQMYVMIMLEQDDVHLGLDSHHRSSICLQEAEAITVGGS